MGIQFVQIGSDESAKKALLELDDELVKTHRRPSEQTENRFLARRSRGIETPSTYKPIVPSTIHRVNGGIPRIVLFGHIRLQSIDHPTESQKGNQSDLRISASTYSEISSRNKAAILRSRLFFWLASRISSNRSPARST